MLTLLISTFINLKINPNIIIIICSLELLVEGIIFTLLCNKERCIKMLEKIIDDVNERDERRNK